MSEENLKTLIDRGFMTCVSGVGDGSSYVKIAFRNLKDAQNLHRLLVYAKVGKTALGRGEKTVIEVSKREFRKLEKIRHLLDDANFLYNELPESLQEEIKRSKEPPTALQREIWNGVGDHLERCLRKGLEAARETVEGAAVKK